MGSPKTVPVISIVGGASPLGRDIHESITETGLPVRVKLIGADEQEPGTLMEAAGEPVVMTALDEENLGGSRAAFLAGSRNSGLKALELISRMSPGPVVVDVTHLLEDQPGAKLRAPMCEPDGYKAGDSKLQVIAHPAAIVLAIFLERLHRKHPMRRAVVHVFEPASERGQGGLEELQQQTVNLLTFKSLPKRIFDEQLGFNLLSRYGSEAPESLEAIEHRIERHLASLLAMRGAVPMPSLRMIQAPVFHGHSLSIWVEFEQNPGTEALGEAIASAQIDVRGPDLDAPTNVGIAGQSGMAVGAIAIDRNDARAAWFWVVADNFKITADNAVAVIKALVQDAA